MNTNLDDSFKNMKIYSETYKETKLTMGDVAKCKGESVGLRDKIANQLNVFREKGVFVTDKAVKDILDVDNQKKIAVVSSQLKGKITNKEEAKLISNLAKIFSSSVPKSEHLNDLQQAAKITATESKIILKAVKQLEKYDPKNLLRAAVYEGEKGKLDVKSDFTAYIQGKNITNEKELNNAYRSFINETIVEKDMNKLKEYSHDESMDSYFDAVVSKNLEDSGLIITDTKVSEDLAEIDKMPLAELINKSGSINALKTIKLTLENLPEEEEGVPKGFMDIPVNVIGEVQGNEKVADLLSDVIDGRNLFKEVLTDLTRIKDKLGGSPNFRNDLPKIDLRDNNKKLFGIPLPAVRDWFNMVAKEGWPPKLFWTTLAQAFGASKKSQYEETYMGIQRFGLLVANKETFVGILNSQNEERYQEFGTITGLAWHPDINGGGTEKQYMEFVEKFLTDYYVEAKTKGDDALVEYFQAFQGVCFENRCRNLEEYAFLHPLAGEENLVTLKDIIDIDSNEPANVAFDNVLNHLGQKHGEVSIDLFYEALEENNIYNMEFPTDAGINEKPSLEDAHLHLLKAIEAWTLDPYPVQDFLQMEYQIFANSEKELTVDSFKAQLQKRDGSNQGEFSVDLPEVDEFIEKLTTEGKLS